VAVGVGTEDDVVGGHFYYSGLFLMRSAGRHEFDWLIMCVVGLIGSIGENL
jgi:hypothetical protein